MLKIPSAKNALMAMVVIAACIMFAELTLKVISPQHCYAYPKGMVQEDKGLCYKISPDYEGRIKTAEFDITITTNSHGLRDAEHSYEKPNGTLRILGLGDSFQFGVGVQSNQTYLKLLERELQQKGFHAEVINAGVLGYGTRQELQYFKDEGRRYKPEIVILSFYQNDLLDNMLTAESCNRFVRDGYLVDNFTASQRAASFKIKLFLNQKSDLYCLAKNSALRLAPKIRIGDIQANLSSETVLTYLEKGNLSPAIQERFNVTFGLILQLKQAVQADGGRLIIVIIPDQLQVDKNILKTITDSYRLDIDKYDLTKLGKILVQFATSQNITAIDLLPDFQQQAGNEKLYYPIEAHWNPRGHLLAAEVVGEKIEDYLNKTAS